MKWKLEEEKIRDEEDEVSHMFSVQIQKNEQHWREILTCVAATVKFLAKNNLSFRGHRESIQESKPGNLLAALKFLGEFDDVMHLHLEKIEVGKTLLVTKKIQCPKNINTMPRI